MTSFNMEKKKAHEAAAAKALKASEYAEAAFHTAEAAKFTFALADRCEGKLKTVYESNATDLVEIAEELRKRVAGKADSRRESAGSFEKCRVERPSVRLCDVAGMEDVKNQIRLRLVEPLKHPDEAKKHGLKVGGGILLYGPPGTGKTFIAKAEAGELDLPFYSITPADVFGKYVGESEGNVRNVFREARKNPLSVVFIDEVDAIFRRRSEVLHETTQKVIAVMLQELDGIGEARNPVLLLGASNTPWMIDEAFLRNGRFDVMAYVGLPNAEARGKILSSAFADVKYPVDADAINYTISRTDGYSGADLKGIAQKVKQLAFDRSATTYGKELFMDALDGSAPSCTKEISRRIEEWEKASGIK